MMRKDSKRAKINEIPDAVDPLKTRIQIREVKAHKDNLHHISVSSELGTIASCSADFTVRIWSPGFDLWGTLNQASDDITDSKWFFPSQYGTNKRHADFNFMT